VTLTSNEIEEKKTNYAKLEADKAAQKAAGAPPVKPTEKEENKP